MTRLFVQIYATLVGTIALVILAAALAAAVALHGEDRVPAHLGSSLRVMGRLLPPASAPADLQADAIVALSAEAGIDLELFAADGEPVQADRAWEGAPDATPGGVFVRRPGRGIAVRLLDGRTLAAVVDEREQLPRFLLVLVLVGLGAAVGAWPVSRRLSSRLERLRAGVARFGDDLGARVDVTGGDEVADVARAFNASADRIEALLLAQRRQLAGASHELRSPLARLRMAVELVGEVDGAARASLVDGAVRDIGELDDLVAELLLAARMDAGAREDSVVDLGALAREEAARVGGEVSGDATLRGDASALRRMLRNLLENAARHGAPPIRLGLAGPDPVVVSVTDGGPGVGEAERERIFEAFHRPAGHAEGRGGGVGLGLALVRQIAEAHGGTATCDGPAFVVTLSRTPRAADRAATPPSRPDPARSSTAGTRAPLR